MSGTDCLAIELGVGVCWGGGGWGSAGSLLSPLEDEGGELAEEPAGSSSCELSMRTWSPLLLPADSAASDSSGSATSVGSPDLLFDRRGWYRSGEDRAEESLEDVKDLWLSWVATRETGENASRNGIVCSGVGCLEANWRTRHTMLARKLCAKGIGRQRTSAPRWKNLRTDSDSGLVNTSNRSKMTEQHDSAALSRV
jgi:hypothetical protein